MLVISLIAGPSFIPITVVKCVSVSFGKHDPSIKFSEKTLKTQIKYKKRLACILHMVTRQRSDDNMLSIRQKAMRYLDPKTDK